MSRSTRFGLRAVPLALLGAFTQIPAQAAEISLAETVVSANRRDSSIDNATTTVTAVGREQLDRRQPMDAADLFRDETDVVMSRDLRRYGSTRVNIRGIDDNRVVQTIDGVRMPDYLDKSGPTNYMMSSPPGVMPDFLRRVEIVRGPASSLYGSDALGGLVGYVTLSPEDIAQGDARFGARIKGTYSSANQGFSGTLIGAWRGEVVDFMLGYSQASSNEYDNMGKQSGYGALRTKPNQLDNNDKGAIAKLVLRPAVGHRLTTTLEGRRTQTDSDILRHTSAYSRVSSMTGTDDSKRLRGSIEYEHKPTDAFYDRLTARLSHQVMKTDNTNDQRRSQASYYLNGSGCSASSNTRIPAGPMASLNNITCDMLQDFRLEQKQTAVNVQFDSMFEHAGISHILTYGLDLSRQEVETYRDGTVIRLDNGVVTKNVAGENYPLRDFPNGQTDTLGAFVQDEIGLFDNRLRLTPGVRYDRTKLKPDHDPLSVKMLNSLGLEPTSATWSRVSPKLGLQWQIDPVLSTYGQIASGFRSPNYNEVNGAFRNTTYGYGVAASPDLKPETSAGIELGLRGRTENSNFQVAAYDNRYKDFIEQIQLGCPSDPSCIAGLSGGTYQNRNIAKVRIYGLDVRGAYRLTHRWLIDGSLSYTRGKNEETGAGLNSVEPMRATLGVTYDAGSWGTEGRLRLAKAKSKDSLSANSTLFRTAGYGVTDLTAWYRPSKNTRIVATVNNLLDKKYRLWGDVRHYGLTATEPGADFFTQPGRNFRLSLQADF